MIKILILFEIIIIFSIIPGCKTKWVRVEEFGFDGEHPNPYRN